MALAGSWSFPTSVRFGAGRICELGAAAKAAGMAKPLLVTDARLAATTLVPRAFEILEQDGVPAELCVAVRPNPSAANVDAGLQALKSGRHDGIIAFGGGSALDTG